MATTSVKVAGTWQAIAPLSVKVAGTWQALDNMKAKVAGVWETVYAALSAIFNTNGDFNLRLGADCYAGLQINSSGIEYEYTNTGVTTNIGTWLVAGTAAEVWVECVLTSGTWNSINAGTGTRLQCSTTRSWRCVRTSSGTHTVTCTFNFYDAASGGNLLDSTGSIQFIAEYGV